MQHQAQPNEIMVLCDRNRVEQLSSVLSSYGLNVIHLTENETIPGSFWQAPEAGLIGNKLYVRSDTPLHSALHEACHYICMDAKRRDSLDTDAGGDYDEENAVCYLQIMLADHFKHYNRQTIMTEMDAWGYSFRLGSAAAWFKQDASDALFWLINNHILDDQHQPTGQTRK